MTFHNTTWALARAAHECWRETMSRSGWKWAPLFDEDARRHDALTDFESIPAIDQRLTVRAIEASGLSQRAADLVDYPRGPDRELAVEEICVGLRVALATELGNPDAEFGHVVSWVASGSGDLELVTVRWPDQTITEHVPAERELARLND